eukprot:CAMPEP_0114491564 /NCGR_PEP_ID=MMETSP0109-20121206/3072_1 /TAXON_ID=29199 /ORGANISM="Chlorarachnion reptans, Strain CCCM449" /LENGTH=1062 /DNA_ID=CAMNT_0001668315 /DNA_START=115 /DNA_END=3303 /DNA_ORIENTATION=-
MRSEIERRERRKQKSLRGHRFGVFLLTVVSTLLVVVRTGEHDGLFRRREYRQPRLGIIMGPGGEKKEKRIKNIWHNPPPPPSEFYFSNKIGDMAPWLSLKNPPLKDYSGVAKKKIQNWATLWPRQDQVHDIWWLNFPNHIGPDWDDADDWVVQDPFRKPNLTAERLRPDFEERTIEERGMQGVIRHRFRDWNLFMEPKHEKDENGTYLYHETTEDFADTDVQTLNQTITRPEDIIYESDPWEAEAATDADNRYAPERNELCLTYNRNRIPKNILVELIEEKLGDFRESYRILEESDWLGYPQIGFLRFYIPGLSKKEMQDYAIMEFVPRIKGVMWHSWGGIDNPEEEVSKDSLERSQDDPDPYRDTETDGFSADGKRVARLVRDERDEEGRRYGKEERSPFWSGRFPGINAPKQYDMSRIRLEAGDLTVYNEESEKCSPHYSYTGFYSTPFEVKWHHFPNGEEPWLMSVCGDNNYYTFLSPKATLMKTIKYHNNAVFQVRWNHIGTRFVSAGADHRIMFFNEGGECTALRYDIDEVRAVSFDRLSERIFFGGRSERLNIWELRDGPYGDTSFIPLDYELDFILTLKNNASLVLTAGKGQKTIDVWNIDTGELVRQLRVDEGPLTDLRLSVNEDYIVASSGKFVYTWKYLGVEAAEPENFAYHQGFEERRINVRSKVDLVAFDETLGRLVVKLKGNGKEVRGYNFSTGECLRTFIGHKKKITSLDLGPDGFLVTGSADKTIRLWPWPRPEAILKTYQEFEDIVPNSMLDSLPEILPASMTTVDKRVLRGIEMPFFQDLQRPRSLLENRTAEHLLFSSMGIDSKDPERYDIVAELDRYLEDKMQNITGYGADEQEEDRQLKLNATASSLPKSAEGFYNDLVATYEEFPNPEFGASLQQLDPKTLADEFAFGDRAFEVSFSDLSDSVYDQMDETLVEKARRAAYERQFRKTKRKAEHAERNLQKRAADQTLSDTRPTEDYSMNTDSEWAYHSDELPENQKIREKHPKNPRIKSKSKMSVPLYYPEEEEAAGIGGRRTQLPQGGFVGAKGASERTPLVTGEKMQMF